MKLRSRSALALTILSVVGLFALNYFFAGLRGKYYLVLSSSVPPGVYRFSGSSTIEKGRFVLLALPKRLSYLTKDRDWLTGAPLTKVVAATTGDTVCSDRSGVSINGKFAGPVFQLDHSGLPLPHLEGCVEIAADEAFLLAARNPYAFDSRYFGPVKKGELRPVELVFGFADANFGMSNN